MSFVVLLSSGCTTIHQYNQLDDGAIGAYSEMLELATSVQKAMMDIPKLSTSGDF